MLRTIALCGLTLGAVLLQWLQYRMLVREHPGEIYSLHGSLSTSGQGASVGGTQYTSFALMRSAS